MPNRPQQRAAGQKIAQPFRVANGIDLLEHIEQDRMILFER